MTEFVPGRQLCEAFYHDVIAPLVDAPHAAGLLGTGSDVLGFDTERSTDHDWGPRCTVLLDSGPTAELRSRILKELPDSFHGWPLSIGRAGMPYEPKVAVDTVAAWVRGEVGTDLQPTEVGLVDWLTIPQQRLLALTSAPLFADSSGRLSALRSTLAWFPDDVWWWLLACQWQRLGQEEAFVQRTSEVGDDLGSRVIASRQVRDCVRLALLVARRYAPYGKWLGTAFAELPDDDGLGARLQGALGATTIENRESELGAAYSILGSRFNALKPGLDVDVALRPFHDRPAVVLGASRFADAALDKVRDPALRAFPLIGSVDQLLDSTDALTSPHVLQRLRGVYSGLA